MREICFSVCSMFINVCICPVSPPTGISHVREMQFQLFTVWYLFVWSVLILFVCTRFLLPTFLLLFLPFFPCSVPFDPNFRVIARISHRSHILIYALCKHRQKKISKSKCTHARKRSSNDGKILLANVRVCFLLLLFVLLTSALLLLLL